MFAPRNSSPKKCPSSPNLRAGPSTSRGLTPKRRPNLGEQIRVTAAISSKPWREHPGVPMSPPSSEDLSAGSLSPSVVTSWPVGWHTDDSNNKLTLAKDVMGPELVPMAGKARSTGSPLKLENNRLKEGSKSVSKLVEGVGRRFKQNIVQAGGDGHTVGKGRGGSSVDEHEFEEGQHEKVQQGLNDPHNYFPNAGRNVMESEDERSGNAAKFFQGQSRMNPREHFAGESFSTQRDASSAENTTKRSATLSSRIQAITSKAAVSSAREDHKVGRALQVGREGQQKPRPIEQNFVTSDWQNGPNTNTRPNNSIGETKSGESQDTSQLNTLEMMESKRLQMLSTGRPTTTVSTLVSTPGIESRGHNEQLIAQNLNRTSLDEHGKEGQEQSVPGRQQNNGEESLGSRFKSDGPRHREEGNSLIGFRQEKLGHKRVSNDISSVDSKNLGRRRWSMGVPGIAEKWLGLSNDSVKVNRHFISMDKAGNQQYLGGSRIHRQTRNDSSPEGSLVGKRLDSQLKSFLERRRGGGEGRSPTGLSYRGDDGKILQGNRDWSQEEKEGEVQIRQESNKHAEEEGHGLRQIGVGDEAASPDDGPTMRRQLGEYDEQQVLEREERNRGKERGIHGASLDQKASQISQMPRDSRALQVVSKADGSTETGNKEEADRIKQGKGGQKLEYLGATGDAKIYVGGRKGDVERGREEVGESSVGSEERVGPLGRDKRRLSGRRSSFRGILPVAQGRGGGVVGFSELDEWEQQSLLQSQGFVTSRKSDLYVENDEGWEGGTEDSPDEGEDSEREWDLVPARSGQVGEDEGEVRNGRDEGMATGRQFRSRRKGVGRWGRGWVREAAAGLKQEDILLKMREVEEVAKANRDEEWREELGKVIVEDMELKKENEQLRMELENLTKEKVRLEQGRNISGERRRHYPNGNGAEWTSNNSDISEREWENNVHADFSDDGLWNRLRETEKERDFLLGKVEHLKQEAEALREHRQLAETLLGKREITTESMIPYWKVRMDQAVVEAESHRSQCQSLELQLVEEKNNVMSLQDRLTADEAANLRAKQEKENARKREMLERERRAEAERRATEAKAEVRRSREEGKGRVFELEEKMKEAMSEMERLERERIALLKTVEECQLREAQLKEEIDAREQLLERARTEVAAASEGVEDSELLRKRIEAVVSEKNQTENLVEKLKKELGRLREDSRVKDLAMEDGKDVLEDMKKVAKEEAVQRARLEILLQDAEGKIGKLEADHKTAQDQALLFKRQIEDLQEKIETEMDVRGRVTRQLEDEKRRETELKEALKLWEGKVTVLENKLREKEKAKADLDNEVAEKEDQMRKWRQKLVEKEVQCSVLSERLKDKETECRETKETLQEHIREIRELRDERARLSTELTISEKAREEATRKCNALEADLLKSDTELKEMKANKQRWEGEFRNEMRKAKDMQESTKKAIIDSENVKQTYLEKIAVLQTENDSLLANSYLLDGEIAVLRGILNDKGIYVDD